MGNLVHTYLLRNKVQSTISPVCIGFEVSATIGSIFYIVVWVHVAM